MNVVRALLAVLLPALLLGAWLGTYGAWDTPETPDVAPPAAEKPVDLLIAGNSQAELAVDEAALSEALGRKVVKKTANGAHGPALYALLLARVFGEGYRPKEVLLVASLSQLQDMRPPENNLESLMAEPMVATDPVLQQKLYGRAATPNSPMDRVLGEVWAGRDQLLAGLTTLPLVLVGEADPTARLQAARTTVFGAGDQMVERVSVMPTGGGEGAAASAADTRSLADTLFPDIVALCQRYGAKVSVATLPQRRRGLTTQEEGLDEVRALLQQAGGKLVILDDVAIPEDAWLDKGHVAARGATLYTAALSEALQGRLSQVKLTRATRSDPAMPPFSVEVAEPCLWKVKLRGGDRWSDVQLERLGLGAASPVTVQVGDTALSLHQPLGDNPTCDGRAYHNKASINVAPPPGASPDQLQLAFAPTPYQRVFRGEKVPREDSYWVPGGGALELAFDQLPPGSSSIGVLAGGGSGEPAPEVQVGDDAPVTLSRWGNLWWGEVPVGAKSGAWTLKLRSSGPDLWLRTLVALGGSAPVPLYGGGSDLGHQIILVPGESLRLRGESQPKVWPESVTLKDGAVNFRVSAPHDGLTLAAIAKHGEDVSRWARICPPFVVKGPDDTSYKGLQKKAGTVEAALHGSPAEGAYRLSSRPGVLCQGGAWLLPESALEIAGTAGTAIQVPADQLRLEIGAFPPVGAVKLRMVVDEVTVLDTTVDGARLDGAPLTVPLDVVLEPGFRKVVFAVEAPAESWVMLRSITVGASMPPDAWFLR